MAFFLYVGKRLHTFCTPFAHLPESGAFLRMACTACFPLHKNGTCRGEAPPSAIADRSVTQTPHWGVCCFANVNLLCEQGSRQFSAFICVHQPDGFKDLLTGDFCCRRLFVLPGSGLGNRSSIRFSRSVPAGACPACGRRRPSGQMPSHGRCCFTPCTYCPQGGLARVE